jgi:hypothetical protein
MMTLPGRAVVLLHLVEYHSEEPSTDLPMRGVCLKLSLRAYEEANFWLIKWFRAFRSHIMRKRGDCFALTGLAMTYGRRFLRPGACPELVEGGLALTVMGHVIPRSSSISLGTSASRRGIPMLMLLRSIRPRDSSLGMTPRKMCVSITAP